MVLSEDFDKRSANLHFSAMRVTKANTFRASTSNTSHTTIVVLNIFEPSLLQLPFSRNTSVTNVLFLTGRSAAA
jgi:hypothetical protein